MKRNGYDVCKLNVRRVLDEALGLGYGMHYPTIIVLLL